MEFRQVRYSYEGSREEALRGVDFKIGHGEKVALLGPNGAGKSTLLLHTDGLLLPASGEVVVCGMPGVVWVWCFRILTTSCSCPR